MYTIAVIFYILIIFWTWKSLNFAYFRLSLELVRSYVVTFNFKHGNFVIFYFFGIGEDLYWRRFLIFYNLFLMKTLFISFFFNDPNKLNIRAQKLVTS